jgi:hypothetical protein
MNLVRPDATGKPVYATRTKQIEDAMFGIGGWSGFLPIAPSLQDNLRDLEKQAEKADKLKYESVAQEIPWTYFPFETWAYLFLLGLSLDSALVGGAYMTGTRFFGESLLYRISHWMARKCRQFGAFLVSKLRERKKTQQDTNKNEGQVNQ